MLINRMKNNFEKCLPMLYTKKNGIIIEKSYVNRILLKKEKKNGTREMQI